MLTLLTAITQYLYTLHLLLATPRTKWWPHLALLLFPLQARHKLQHKRTAQTEAAKHRNEQFLEIMCEIKLYL